MPEYVSPISGIAQGLQQSLSNVTNLSTLLHNAQQIRNEQQLFPLRQQQAQLGLEREKMARSVTEAQYSQLMVPFDPNAYKDHPLYSEENVSRFNEWFDNTRKWFENTPYKDYYVTHDNKPTKFAWETFKGTVATDPKELEGAIVSALVEKQGKLSLYEEGLKNLEEKMKKGTIKPEVYESQREGYIQNIRKYKYDIATLTEQRAKLIPVKDLLAAQESLTKATKHYIVRGRDGNFYIQSVAGDKVVGITPLAGVPMEYLKEKISSAAKSGEQASPRLKSHATKVRIPGRIGTLDAIDIPIQYFTDETTGQNYIRDKNNQLIPVSSNVVLEFLKMNYPQVADRYIESLGGGTFGKSRGSGGSKTYEDKQKRFRVTIEQ